MRKLNGYLLYGLTIMMLGTAPAYGQSVTSTATPREHQVRAAILYNLARFSQWPDTRFETQNSNFKICVNSEDPMKPALKTLKGKPVNGHPIIVNTVSKNSNLSVSCHLMYVSQKVESAADLKKYIDFGILTVGNGESFVNAGGGISIQRVGNRMGFSINKTAMDQIEIAPSSKILKLASAVH